MSSVNAGGVGVFGKWVDGDGGRVYVLKSSEKLQLQVLHLLTLYTQEVTQSMK